MKRIKRTAVIRCAGISLRHRIAEDETGGSDCLSLKSCYPPGTAVCMFGCLGGGSCLEVCPRHAIVFRDNGCAMVDREKCIGCGKCVKVCPQQLIELVPAENNIQPQCSSQAPAKTVKEVCISGCIGCGICEKVDREISHTICVDGRSIEFEDILRIENPDGIFDSDCPERGA